MSRAYLHELTVLLVVTSPLGLTVADEARRWPNDRGEIIRADLVLIRSNDVVLCPQPYHGKLVVVPLDKLRPVDRRFLHLDQQRKSDYGEVFEKLAQPLRDLAAVHDAATLVRAAAHFRGKSKAEILEVFQQYVDSQGGHELWLLAPVIFEPCPAYPNFWREDLTVLSEFAWPGAWPWETGIFRGQPMLLDVTHGGAHSGPGSPRAALLIEWAKQYGTVRASWPVPELIPTELVNRTEALADERHRARYQAWRLVRHLFSLEWKVAFEFSLDDERWNRLHELCTSMEITWDEKEQKFRQSNGFIVPPPPDNWLPRTLVPTPSVPNMLVRSYHDD